MVATSAVSRLPSPSLRVLVVDDTMANRQVLGVFLKRLGHAVAMAEEGAQAVALFAAQPFDLVIMDVMMPVMDGYEATRRIKALCGDHWVPVVFLSALDKDESLVAGLEAGGDDYLSKPINFSVLEAKLRSLTRTLGMQRTLETYHDEREAENTLAVQILEQLMQRPGLADPLLHYWMSPANYFSGDIVAAARSNDGRYHALLADATGHGLAAAISVLPVLSLFYDAVECGIPLTQILAKINGQLRETLPVGRFVACSGVCVDVAQGKAELWLGGMPAAWLLAATGQVLQEFRSPYLPLGIDVFDWREMPSQTIEIPDAGGQLVLFSDGLIESQNAGGEPFGVARLQAALAAAPADQRIAAVQEAVNAHRGACEPHDDITLLLIDLPALSGAST